MKEASCPRKPDANYRPRIVQVFHWFSAACVGACWCGEDPALGAVYELAEAGFAVGLAGFCLDLRHRLPDLLLSQQLHGLS